MRIAYLINQYPMVSHSFIRREIIALERLGFDVVRIALRGWDSKLVDLDDEAERRRTRYVISTGAAELMLAVMFQCFRRPIHFVRALRLAWRMSRHAERPVPIHFAYLAEACQVARWLRGSGVAHLHAHFGTNSAEIAMLVHVLDGPTWSFTVHGPEEFDKAPLLGLVEKIHRCSFVVAISSFGRSQLFRLVGKKYWPKVHVVRCGLDDMYFEAPASSHSAARRLVCVGRLCEQKGQLFLIEAMRVLAGEGTTFELVLVGDGNMRREIEDLVHSYGLTNYVRITGWISGSKVKEEILAARAIVLPSFAEGLPVVLMEAMALRRPVISTNIAGIPELVKSGVHGWLVPASDLEALVEAIRDCLNSSTSALMRMGEDACKRVSTLHDIDVEAAKLKSLIFQSIGYGR
jgi:glycosyltransferase involved in cell wall biosynthesis